MRKFATIILLVFALIGEFLLDRLGISLAALRAAGGILPASKADVPLDFGGPLAELGCFVGSHAVVVLSDQDDIKAIALNLMKFFEDESCGQCTPCRNGTEKAVQLMSQDTWDIEALKDLAEVMADASICGLGQAAPNPLLCVMEHFQEDLK